MRLLALVVGAITDDLDRALGTSERLASSRHGFAIHRSQGCTEACEMEHWHG